jgi:signal transduction histidine kinase/ligand-binding sensor domain-containing protein
MLSHGEHSPALRLRMTAGRSATCLCGLFALFIWAPTARGQYRFDHWTTENGLPQNSVRGIVQTRDGYLWLTTFDGLVRFDGVRFTVFNKSNSPGIASNRFTGIFEDRFGDLWVAIETGGLVRRRQGRFMTYTRTEGLPTDAPLFVNGDGDGNLVISSGPRHFRWLEGGFLPADDYHLPVIQVPEERRAKLFGNPVHVTGKRTPLQAISRDSAGSLWLTDLDSMQRQLLSREPPEELDYHTVYADNEDNYWFITSLNGLFRARKGSVTPYAKVQGLNVREVYPLLQSRDGSIWIGTIGNGLFRLKDGAFTNYMSGGDVTSLYEDGARQLWINGSSRLEQGRLIRAPWVGSPPNHSLLQSWAMCEDRAGAYWIGMGDGVARYLNGVMTYFTTNDGLAGNDTKVIINDTSGGLWIGSYGGLTHYKDGKFTAWTEKDGLPGNTVRALKQDGDGALWIGAYDSGLGRFKDGRFTRYTTKDGLFDNGVFQILEDDYGWFWMSCNRGIYRVRKQELNDFAEGRLRTITCLAYNKGDGMPSAECNGGRWPAGFKARDGKLWFPTMGGVAVIDPANIRTNTQPPPVVIEEMLINNQSVSLEAWQSAIGAPQSSIRIERGQENFEIQYTALSFINSENMRFKYKLEGADHDWVEAGARRTAYFSHVSPGEYTFKVIAANSDGVWNLTGASVRITVIPPFWWRWWFITTVLLVVACAIVGAWKYRVAQLQRIQAAQQAFARQLIASQESERKRIAGELHDSLGQNLLIVKNRAQLGQLAARDAPEIQEQFDWILASATQSIEEVREIAQNLRPYHLDRLGLTKAIEVMIEKVASTTGIRFVSELTPLDDLFGKEDAITLYRVVQESLNNIVKHAQAGEARVSVERLTDSVTLAIRDNGRGFSIADFGSQNADYKATKLTPQSNPQSTSHNPQSCGFGLTGMAERVRMLGGVLQIDSQAGHGTTVIIRFALPITTKGETV